MIEQAEFLSGVLVWWKVLAVAFSPSAFQAPLRLFFHCFMPYWLASRFLGNALASSILSHRQYSMTSSSDSDQIWTILEVLALVVLLMLSAIFSGFLLFSFPCCFFMIIFLRIESWSFISG